MTAVLFHPTPHPGKTTSRIRSGQHRDNYVIPQLDVEDVILADLSHVATTKHPAPFIDIAKFIRTVFQVLRTCTTSKDMTSNCYLQIQ